MKARSTTENRRVETPDPAWIVRWFARGFADGFAKREISECDPWPTAGQGYDAECDMVGGEAWEAGFGAGASAANGASEYVKPTKRRMSDAEKREAAFAAGVRDALREAHGLAALYSSRAAHQSEWFSGYRLGFAHAGNAGRINEFYPRRDVESAAE